MSQKNVNILSSEMSKESVIFYDLFRYEPSPPYPAPNGARSCSCALYLNLLETTFPASARYQIRESNAFPREPRDVEALVGSGAYSPVSRQQSLMARPLGHSPRSEAGRYSREFNLRVAA